MRYFQYKMCSHFFFNLFGNSAKVTIFGRAAFSYSNVQPFSHPSTLTSYGHWATSGNQRSGLPGETISLPVSCAANIRRPVISNLHRHRPLRVSIQTLFELSLGDSFLVPREIHVRPVYYLNHRHLDLQSNVLPPDQRTPQQILFKRFQIKNMFASNFSARSDVMDKHFVPGDALKCYFHYGLNINDEVHALLEKIKSYLRIHGA